LVASSQNQYITGRVVDYKPRRVSDGIRTQPRAARCSFLRPYHNESGPRLASCLDDNLLGSSLFNIGSRFQPGLSRCFQSLFDSGSTRIGFRCLKLRLSDRSSRVWRAMQRSAKKIFQTMSRTGIDNMKDQVVAFVADQFGYSTDQLRAAPLSDGADDQHDRFLL
jgi:hypothetical protein